MPHMDIRTLHEEALQSTHRYVAGIDATQWQLPTPCAAWNLRQLVNHLVAGDRWVRELGLGRTIEDVGTTLDGDLLHDDPIAAHQDAVTGAATAFATDDAMTRLWPLPYSPRPGRVYARQRFIDVLIHGWDVATASGQDTRLPADLVAACLAIVEERPQIRAQWGFSEVDTPADADPQTRLLAFAGRSA
jgi:uncharacterized protein (TIGR03086 family)